MIQDNEVFVIDDFIEKEYQEQIKKVLLGSEPFDNQEFPWYFIEDVQQQVIQIVNIDLQ